MKVLVADKNAERAERVAKEVGGEALVFGIANYDAAKAALAGHTVDVLVNNAGWDRFQNFVDTDPAEWDARIDINLRGPLNMHHLVLPGMLERGSGRRASGRRESRSTPPAGAGSFRFPRPSPARLRARASPSTWCVSARPTRRSCAVFWARAKPGRRSTTRWCARSR
jgi:NAD(P)-dependent dehydrogenase (short-subunit alcohol dehydrogenase family)